MYSEVFQQLRRLAPYIAAVIVLSVLSSLAQKNFIAQLLLFPFSLMAWAYLAFESHKAFLFGSKARFQTTFGRVFGFVLRAFGISLIMGVLSIVLGLIFLPPGAIERASYYVNVSRIDISFFLLSGSGIAVAFILVFALFGTILPAYVADNERGIDLAMKRGRSQFFWIAGHYLIGPILLMAIASTIALQLNTRLAFDGFLWRAPFLTVLIIIAIMVLITFLQTLATVMTAWVLSTAFKRAGGLKQLQSSQTEPPPLP